jgi:AP-2 complex subunit alpha
LERLSYANEGVLYEDKQIQIGVKAEYHGHLGRIALFLGNKISTPFTSLSASVDNSSPNALSVSFHDNPVREIAPLAQIQELIHVECKDVFTEPPVLRLTYLAGTFATIVLRLPVFLSRFVEGVTLEQGPFFERWKIIGGKWGAALGRKRTF